MGATMLPAVLLLFLSAVIEAQPQGGRPRGAGVDLSKVRAGDLAGHFGLAQDMKQKREKAENEKIQYAQSELDKELGSSKLHLIVESPKWTKFNKVCKEGATLHFVAENRLLIRTPDWLGTGTVRSGFPCQNVTRCSDHDLTVVEISSGMLKVQHDILGVTCSSDVTNTQKTLYQIGCGGGEGGCYVYGPAWIREIQQAKANSDLRQDGDHRPGFANNPFPYTEGDG